MKKGDGYRGRLIKLSVSPAGRQILTIELDGDFRPQFDELKKADVTVDIRKWYKKRSLSANAYAWTLIDRIAGELGITKTDVYRKAIQDIPGVSQTVCVKAEAVDRLCDLWKAGGLGWQVIRFESKIPGCVNVILYTGSSAYNTKQMSTLIDSLVQECHDLGIETLTPEEIKSLLDQERRWER